MNKSILFLFTFLISLNVYSLVDYSNPVGGATESRPQNIPRPSQNFSESSAISSEQRTSREVSYVELKAGYQNIDVGLDSKSGSVSKTNLSAFIQTPYDLFFKADYFIASSSEEELSPSKKGTQSGNAELMVGFNWLTFGAPANAMNFDLIGGALIGQKNSDFATSRNEAFLGLETSKRFSSLAFGIAYQYRFTGTPDASSGELQVGDIQKVSASLGWMISSDIRFALEGGRYTIESSDEAGQISQLDEKLEFSYISPTLSLDITPQIAIDLGAVFRAERENEQKVYQARLWDKTGSYGNSLYASLGVNF